MPHIDSISPVSGERGDRFTVRIEGDALSHINEASFGEGIAVSRLKIIDDGTVTVKIDIINDAALGMRDVTLREPGDSETLQGAFEVLPD